MKKLFFIFVMITMILLATNCFSWVWTKYNPAFMGSVFYTTKKLGEIVEWKEYAWPAYPWDYTQTLPDSTLSLDNIWIIFSAKSNEIEFKNAETGDPWWQTSYLILGGTWTEIFISIKGKWNPARNGADTWGRTCVFCLQMIPLVPNPSLIYHETRLSQDEQFNLETKAAPPNPTKWVEYKKIIIQTTQTTQIATTWGRVKQ